MATTSLTVMLASVFYLLIYSFNCLLVQESKLLSDPVLGSLIKDICYIGFFCKAFSIVKSHGINGVTLPCLTVQSSGTKCTHCATLTIISLPHFSPA